MLYDAFNGKGEGYVTMGLVNGETQAVKMPPETILYHELAHAAHYADGTFSAADPEAQAMADENRFRAALGLPQRTGHLGSLVEPAPKPKATTSSGGDFCFVATAAHGSALAFDVERLRAFREMVLRPTITGSAFFDQFYETYARISPRIVEVIESDPEVRDLVRRTLVTPIIHYLSMLETFPTGALPDVASGPGAEEWGRWVTWLTEARDHFDTFASVAAPEPALGTMDPATALGELAMYLRYAVRDPRRRAAWLADLSQSGVLPFDLGPEAAEEAAATLTELGLDPLDIDRVIRPLPRPEQAPPPAAALDAPTEPAAAVTTKATAGEIEADAGDLCEETAPFAGGAIGEGESDARPLPTDYFYTLTVSNATPDTFDEVILFYKRVGLDGVVFLADSPFSSGDTTVFRLGICSEMESYALGFFIGGELVASFPDEGNFTWAMGQADGRMCEDSLVIG